MNRRDILKTMLALPALNLIGGCRWLPDHPQSNTSGEKLCLFLHGPWAVVLQKSKNYRVTAFVPKTDPRDPIQHEFRFHGPNNAPCNSGGHFELPNDGLVISGLEPQIDRAFNDVLFSVNQWEPKIEDYFVTLDLPTPDAINYVSPLYPALFDSGHNSETRLSSVPLTCVLEYRMQHNNIRLKSKTPQSCGTEKDLRPLSPAELSENYESYRKRMPEQHDRAYSQRRFVPRLLQQYSYIYFLGVGLAPYEGGTGDPKYFDLMKTRSDHAIRFFNERLLPAIYQPGQTIPIGSKLLKAGSDVLQCDPAQKQSSSLRETPVMWQYSMPHLRYAASTENCSSPLVTAVVR